MLLFLYISLLILAVIHPSFFTSFLSLTFPFSPCPSLLDPLRFPFSLFGHLRLPCLYPTDYFNCGSPVFKLICHFTQRLAFSLTTVPFTFPFFLFLFSSPSFLPSFLSFNSSFFNPSIVCSFLILPLALFPIWLFKLLYATFVLYYSYSTHRPVIHPITKKNKQKKKNDNCWHNRPLIIQRKNIPFLCPNPQLFSYFFSP